jgi:hypothetical protein
MTVHFSSSPASDHTHTIPVDVEHIGIRLMIPIFTIIGLVAGFLLGVLLIHAVDESIAGVCGGLPLALVLTAVLLSIGERVIKPRWHSGRHLELDQQSLTLVDKRHGRHERNRLAWSEPVHVDGWYFEVPTRRGRVPKGWYCVSVHLSQNDQEVIVYTFMSPEDARQMKQWESGFTQLVSEKSSFLNTKRRAVHHARQAAQYKKLKGYEQERWSDGAEISPEDFQGINDLLSTYGNFQAAIGN